MFHIARLSLALSLFVSGAALAAPLKLDTTHSRVGFTASTLLFDVDGEFKKFTVEIVEGMLEAPESAKVVATIDAASVDTDNGKRDQHLRSPDFFDVKKHPKLRFTSTKIERTKRGVKMTGELEIRGQKKAVTIPFRVVEGKNGAGKRTRAYRGKTTIDRNDFGVGADSVAAKISLEDEVEIELLLVVFLN